MKTFAGALHLPNPKTLAYNPLFFPFLFFDTSATVEVGISFDLEIVWMKKVAKYTEAEPDIFDGYMFMSLKKGFLSVYKLD